MCNCDNYLDTITTMISMLIGVLIAILFYLGILTNLGFLLKGILALSIGISLFFFVLIVIPRYICCVYNSTCSLLICNVVAILLTLLVVSLGITNTLYLAIFSGIIVFFFVFSLIQFLSLLNKVVNLNYENILNPQNLGKCSCSRRN